MQELGYQAGSANSETAMADWRSTHCKTPQALADANSPTSKQAPKMLIVVEIRLSEMIIVHLLDGKGKQGESFALISPISYHARANSPETLAICVYCVKLKIVPYYEIPRRLTIRIWLSKIQLGMNKFIQSLWLRNPRIYMDDRIVTRKKGNLFHSG